MVLGSGLLPTAVFVASYRGVEVERRESWKRPRMNGPQAMGLPAARKGAASVSACIG